jgi:hypothetical protein
MQKYEKIQITGKYAQLKIHISLIITEFIIAYFAFPSFAYSFIKNRIYIYHKRYIHFLEKVYTFRANGLCLFVFQVILHLFKAQIYKKFFNERLTFSFSLIFLG